MNRAVIGEGSEQLGGIGRSPFQAAYNWRGGYLDHHCENVFKFKDASIVPDSSGIPLNHYRWGGPYYYIVTIGHYGLECFSKFIVNGEADAIARANAVVDWLKANRDSTGAWPVTYDHDWYPGRTRIIRAPWYCAMGQGLAMSFLARMFAHTGDGSLVPVMQDASKIFHVPSEKGGVRAMYNGHVWYEEYPTEPASFVLNGYVYALLGLYDASQATGDSSIKKLYEQGVESLKAMLSLYDLGWCTAYDLTHHSVPGAAPNVARWQYHWIHIQLLSALSQIEGDAFDSYTQRWYKYLFGGRIQQN